MPEGINFDDLRPRGAENAPNDAGAERQPLSRRNFLAGSAALLGGGALMAFPGVAKAHTTDEPPTDVDMLNFALTLEHLEATFYRQGLEIFSGRELGRTRFLRGDGRESLRRTANQFLTLIRDHEVEHVDTLTKAIVALGGEAVPEATYNFEETAFGSPTNFLTVAALLENTGVTAYDGAVAHIENAGLLTNGAQIATVEARHASYLNLITREVPFPDAFDQPVSPRRIFNAAAEFITTPLDAPYGPYPSLAAFRDLLPAVVRGTPIPPEGL